MAKVVVKSKVKKAKRKYPVEIRAPEFLGSVVLGKSSVSDLDKLVGKTSKMNLMYVTGSAKNQNIRLTFKIDEVSSGLANTIVKVYEQIPYYLGRFVRKGSELVEDSFTVTTKDGYNLRVKPFIVTKKNTTNLVSSALRKRVKELVEERCAAENYSEFMSSVIYSRVQNSFKNELRTVYPLKTFEFKKVEVISQ